MSVVEGKKRPEGVVWRKDRFVVVYYKLSMVIGKCYSPSILSSVHFGIIRNSLIQFFSRFVPSCCLLSGWIVIEMLKYLCQICTKVCEQWIGCLSSNNDWISRKWQAHLHCRIQIKIIAGRWSFIKFIVRMKSEKFANDLFTSYQWLCRRQTFQSWTESLLRRLMI